MDRINGISQRKRFRVNESGSASSRPTVSAQQAIQNFQDILNEREEEIDDLRDKYERLKRKYIETKRENEQLQAQVRHMAAQLAQAPAAVQAANGASRRRPAAAVASQDEDEDDEEEEDDEARSSRSSGSDDLASDSTISFEIDGEGHVSEYDIRDLEDDACEDVYGDIELLQGRKMAWYEKICSEVSFPFEAEWRDERIIVEGFSTDFEEGAPLRFEIRKKREGTTGPMYDISYGKLEFLEDRRPKGACWMDAYPF